MSANVRESGPLVQKEGVTGPGLGQPVARNVNVYLSEIKRHLNPTKSAKYLRIVNHINVIQ